MKYYKFFKPVFALIIFGLAGCTSLHSNIKYDLDDIEESTNKQLKEVVLDIRAFEDARKSVPENAILFSESNEDYYLKVGEVEYCVNREYVYSQNKEDVPSQISTIISKHLNKRKAFESVTANNKEIRADYYLTGKLMRFYGQQEYLSPHGYSLLGPLGALVISSVETPIIVEIEIVDLAVYRNDGQLLAEIGSVKERFEEEANGGQNCTNTYRLVNEKLMHVIDKLANKVETTIINSISR